MVTAPSLDVELRSISGDARPLEDWLTTFPLTLAVIDPYTHESAWLLGTIQRVLEHFREAGCRVAWLVTGPEPAARQFLGPLAERFLTFADPDRAMVRSLGLAQLPALVVVLQDGEVLASAEGWDPSAWRKVIEELAELTDWSRTPLPLPGDPVAYPGSPALG